MNKTAKFLIKDGQIKAVLAGATIPDWVAIKGGGFSCWDDYVYLPDSATSLLLLVVRLTELEFKIVLN